jgi:hypothetical protein
LFFDRLDPAWRVVYSRGPHPVLIERQWGSGTIVLSADSYFLSNQAMRQNRYPLLLAWLAGVQSTIVFDEWHLGVSEAPGIASLARKYRLHGVLAGVLLLAGLFAWKSWYSLLPASTGSLSHQDADGVGGRESAAALVNLLRRSIRESEVLFACFDQWKSSVPLHLRAPNRKLDQMEAIIAEERARSPRQRNPVETYRRLSRTLAEKS